MTIREELEELEILRGRKGLDISLAEARTRPPRAPLSAELKDAIRIFMAATVFVVAAISIVLWFQRPTAEQRREREMAVRQECQEILGFAGPGFERCLAEGKRGGKR